MTQPAIVLAGVAKSFPADYRAASWLAVLRGTAPRRTVLHDIDLTIASGEVFGLLGSNGAGKTTLLKMLATLLLPDRGSIDIAGIDALARPLEVKRRIGLSMSDERSFYFRLTARENLAFFGTLAGVPPRALAGRVADVARVVDLGDALDRPVKSYSSGMRQRLAVARALIGDPDIVLFDEPTRAVDPVHALAIRALVRDRLARELGKTIVLCTNALEEAWAVCDRIGILSAGAIAALGPPAAIAARFTEVRRFAITFDRLDDGLAARMRAVPGVERVDVTPTAQGDVANVTIHTDERNFTQLLATISSDGTVVRNVRELDDALFAAFNAAAVERAG
ncbi:MAG: hypothetical protein NVS1B2_19230 [Vulcanimicrobiaceae bacterium]